MKGWGGKSSNSYRGSYRRDHFRSRSSPPPITDAEPAAEVAAQMAAATAAQPAASAAAHQWAAQVEDEEARAEEPARSGDGHGAHALGRVLGFRMKLLRDQVMDLQRGFNEMQTTLGLVADAMAAFCKATTPATPVRARTVADWAHEEAATASMASE
eukprot:TRINITY_DN125307_c0_g1_i1.p1 TRINITY_DN125307_c0_g1~~TRINITY_DN125307_c0_g1_i1.p1  ORF type:complete len:157 (+),score=38.95 TRINITY_DN125307_c0_g1_i1:63-533(+)